MPEYRNFSPAAADARHLWRAYLDQDRLYARDVDFTRLISNLKHQIRWFCDTGVDISFLSSAGTGALECAIGSLPEDTRTIVVTNGYFGQRLLEISHLHLQNVFSLELPFGVPFDKTQEEALHKLIQDTGAQAVIAVHLETSSGLLNDVSLISAIARSCDILTIIDGVSSIGAVHCPLAEWGINCFVASTYKALLCPPGLSMIVADEAFRQRAIRKWSYFFDLPRLITTAEKDSYLWSPSVFSLQILSGILADIQNIGRKVYFDSIGTLARSFRGILHSSDIKLLGEDSQLSPCMTTIDLPEGGASSLAARLKEKDGIVLATGLGDRPEHYLRIGHYPHCSDEDLGRLANVLIEVIRSR